MDMCVPAWDDLQGPIKKLITYEQVARYCMLEPKTSHNHITYMQHWSEVMIDFYLQQDKTNTNYWYNIMHFDTVKLRCGSLRLCPWHKTNTNYWYIYMHFDTVKLRCGSLRLCPWHKTNTNYWYIYALWHCEIEMWITQTLSLAQNQHQLLIYICTLTLWNWDVDHSDSVPGTKPTPIIDIYMHFDTVKLRCGSLRLCPWHKTNTNYWYIYALWHCEIEMWITQTLSLAGQPSNN